MANKNNQNTNNNENNAGSGEGGGGGGEKKQKGAGVTVVVLKMDLHCEGCAGRVVKAVRALDGVESVRIGDSELNKLTVIGNVDPVKLRQKVEEKTKKKVELISPATKKTNDCGGGCGGGDDKKKQTKPDKTKTAAKKEEKKPKELPVTTAVFKVSLHCQGCVRRIHKLVSKTKGFVEMSFDKNKDLVTVKGAIDMKLLVAALQQKLKRVVEIVPVKKDGGDGGGEKKGKGGGEKGKGGSGNDGDGKGGGGEKKGKGSGGGGGEKKGKGSGGGGDDAGGKAEEGVYKMESYVGPIGYPYPHNVFGSGYVDYVHAPQLFSDENPNACVVM